MSIISSGKLWKNESYHETFKEADAFRSKLLNIWEGDEKHKGMQVKVRRLSSRFVVKTRLHPDFEPVKETKKRGKSRKRNKKNSDGRMFDASASI